MQAAHDALRLMRASGAASSCRLISCLKFAGARAYQEAVGVL